MPCGMNMDDLVARMKARGVPGSTEAEQVLEQMLTAETPEPAEAEALPKPTRETVSERKTT